MQCRMVSWTPFIIVAQQRQENNHCEPDAHFAVVTTKQVLMKEESMSVRQTPPLMK